MATKDFFKKLQKSEDEFKKGRKGRSGGLVEVDNGKYIVRGQSVDLDVTSDGTPFVQINCIVVHAEDDADIGGKVAQRTQIKRMSGEYTDAKGKKQKWEITEADQFAEICTALQSLGIETNDMEFDQLEEAADHVSSEHPACRVEVKTNKKDYKFVKWGKPVDDDDLPSLEELVEDEDDDDDDDMDDDDGDDNDDVDDADDDDDMDDDDADDDMDDDDFEPPTKGETVKAKPPKTRRATDYIVKTVNVKKETCSLERVGDDKLFKDVSWDDIVG
jgi:hypothetical protein